MAHSLSYDQYMVTKQLELNQVEFESNIAEGSTRKQAWKGVGDGVGGSYPLNSNTFVLP